MVFARQLADELVHATKVRDTAPFFAGRDKEIETFEWALREAKKYNSASFRIFQGPPGCGKTSLANHLSEKYADKVLFVSCEPDDLSDSPTLSDRIERAAIASGGRLAQAVGTAAETAGERLGVRPIADAALRALASFSSRKSTVALHMDEAHGRVGAGFPGVDQTLLKLHTVGIGVPCVLLLTGLAHTYDAVTSIKGLTRLDENATHEVGTLSKRDCARSTKMMLAALDAAGPAPIRDRLAALTGDLAHGWPAHLAGAQASLCEELVRVDGDLRGVDADAVRDGSNRKRHTYYLHRLRDHPAFHIDRSLTQRILVDVAREPPKSKRALALVCATALGREGATDELEAFGVTSTVMADALLKQGIVRDTERRIVPSIPSMADWAADELGIDPRNPRF